MSKRLYLRLCWAALFLAACQREAPVQGQGTAPKPKQEQSEEIGVYEPGIANVYLSEETALMLEEGTLATKAVAFSNVLGERGITAMERVFPHAGEFEPRTREMGMHRWYRIHYGPSITSDKMSEALQDVPQILHFEPIVRTKAESLPFNDPMLSKQWQYWNDGSGSAEWAAGAQMGVYPVWRNYTTGSPDVIVCVVDTGVQLNHEDLAGNTLADASYNFVAGSTTIDPGDHGTHVAGTIAAVNNNGIGVSGLAGGDAAKGQGGCKIISCQAIRRSNDESGGDTAAAIKWGADHGAVLCNNSWGFDFGDGDKYDTESAKATHKEYLLPNTGAGRSTIKDAVDYFNKYAGMDAAGKQTGPMAGGVVFFSAGNENKPWGPPACYPGIIAVGAIGPQGGRAYYSNYGDPNDPDSTDWVDLAATGGDYRYGNVLSTIVNDYGSMQGTSMSCPHATGAAALLVSYFGGPGFTREMLLERMFGGTNPVITLKNTTIGSMLDITAAFTYGEDKTPGPVTDLTASAESNKITLSWTVTGSGVIPAAGYQVFYGTDKEAVEASTPEKTSSGVRKTTLVTDGLEVGEPTAFSLSSMAFETTYWFKLVGFDKVPSYTKTPSMTSVKTPANNPPVITPSVPIEGYSIRSFETKELVFKVQDPDNHGFNVEIVPGSEAETWMDTEAGWKVTLSGGKVPEGSYSATITATDKYKASSTLVFTYKVLPNEPPVVESPLPNTILDGMGDVKELPLEGCFSDPDQEALTYSAESASSSVLHATVMSGILHLTPIGFGSTSVSVSATDARGEKATFTFRVLVRNPGNDYQIYPNPVVSDLHITNGEAQPEEMSVKIVSSTGGTAFDGQVKASAFEPGVIDMTQCAPGVYSLTIRYKSDVFKQTVVKK